jgi:hypothetical protein
MVWGEVENIVPITAAVAAIEAPSGKHNRTGTVL